MASCFLFCHLIKEQTLCGICGFFSFWKMMDPLREYHYFQGSNTKIQLLFIYLLLLHINFYLVWGSSKSSSI
jgi:hypothetical protein